ncbi:MAG TPA: GNAT family N-acetyltransferase [Dermatophilaceae bacterium]|nr:GNAT family N-acetyltransferase [Dermatophilaceae bacterium]
MSNGREVRSLTVDRLDDLPDPCRTCLRWELDPVGAADLRGPAEIRIAKQTWLSTALLEWGSVGRIVYVDDRPAAYVMYAAPGLVPRATLFPTAPVSGDAVLMMGARVDEKYAGQGLGRLLVQAMAKDVLRRGIRAVEAFASRGEQAQARDGCLVPVEFYTAVGFTTVRDHRRYPRLRLDLRSTLTWREDVEQVVERLLAQVRAPVLAPDRSSPGVS